ncbi:MAG: alpha-glucan family phosphorylase [Firmicutes bacterium]|nr:alpha-glucan family phosphorylase [Bacillota bacterium]
MKKIQRYTVLPNIPKKLKPLLKIAYNLWWTWSPDALDLFRWVDTDIWEQTSHSPIEMLGKISPERFEELEKDEAFLRHLDTVHTDLEKYLKHPTWFKKTHGDKFHGKVAYFSFEYGLHESLRLYSGGLGILSGDHLKSASDLGIPLVAVGLIYKYGYFKQYLNIDGWQQEFYITNDFENMPMTLRRGEDGVPIYIAVEFPGRVVYAQIWELNVGRVKLYLLDTNLDFNSPKDQEISHKLYGGDNYTRIQQEILLGIGGVRALEALGEKPTVFHMNEGHSAFLVFERTRMLMERYHLSFSEARDLVSASSIFTTHTPVPAGIDIFQADMIATYFGEYCKKLGISIGELIGLGRLNPTDINEPFSMPYLAFNFADRSNGVSELHGKVSRDMWRALWPDLPDKLVPLRHVTNGIHTQTWLSDEMARLYDRYLGPQILDNPLDDAPWQKVDKIPESELWRSKERLRERLVSFARGKMKEQLKHRGASFSKITHVDEILDPRALTIGFARRFATYKRATLLFSDPERLAKILNDRDRPVQIIFAGKAHPKDDQGKKLIREIIHLANQEEFRRHLVFLEDYSMEIARYLVQGVDVWMNTPRRPQEASGTSGMKVPPNAGVNLSILDGWWCEGYNGANGWAIGSGEVYKDLDYQDEVEALALYELLEREVVPAFYDRGVDGLPREWIKKMKSSIATLSPVFNTNRMVHEYHEKIYDPAQVQWEELTKNDMDMTRKMERWKRFILEHWDSVYISNVYSEVNDQLKVGTHLEVNATVNLGEIQPDDVAVALFHGTMDAKGDIYEGERVWMTAKEQKEHGQYLFTGDIPCGESGQHGYAVCIYPQTKKLSRRFEKALIKWWVG